jgi:choice-of-anchor A domain-containing protein
MRNLRIAPGLMLASALALLPASPSLAAIVGPAAEYNVFVLGNLAFSGGFTSSNTDTGGNIAAAGNVQLTNYSAASAIVGNAALNPNPARVVAGGSFTGTNGGVGASSGGPAQAGAIYAVGTITRTSFTANGGQFTTSLIDFGAAQSFYQSLAGSWNSVAANGSASLGAGNTLTLTGSDAALNVFSITGAQLTASNSVNISAPTGSTVLINVSGASATFQNGQVTLTGVDPSRVAYNFFEATSVSLAGSKDPRGTILAPYASVVGGFGHMDGQLIAGSYSGNTQFGNVLFSGNVVPLPAAVWLLLSGFAGMAGVSRRRRA